MRLIYLSLNATNSSLTTVMIDYDRNWLIELRRRTERITNMFTAAVGLKSITDEEPLDMLQIPRKALCDIYSEVREIYEYIDTVIQIVCTYTFTLSDTPNFADEMFDIYGRLSAALQILSAYTMIDRVVLEKAHATGNSAHIMHIIRYHFSTPTIQFPIITRDDISIRQDYITDVLVVSAKSAAPSWLPRELLIRLTEQNRTDVIRTFGHFTRDILRLTNEATLPIDTATSHDVGIDGDGL